MGMIRLGDKPPLTVTADLTARQAAQALSERGVGAAVVLAGENVIGVVTERDVLRKVVAAGLRSDDILVRDIMTSPVLSVGVKTTVAAAAGLMREHHIRHLVVQDENGKLVGMLALRYLLYELMDDMQRNVGDLVGYIMIDGPGG